MFCPKCGSQLSDTATFCNKCGAQVQARQAQQAVENQNTSETRLNLGESAAVQSQAQAVSNVAAKPSISGVRIAAIVIAMLAVCTSFMPWYEPGSGLASIVNSASSFLGLLSGGSVSIPTLEESYNLWMIPDLVSTASTLFEYAGRDYPDSLLFLYIPFILFVVGVVLAVVGIIKTYKRNGGKAALVWANVVFLLAYLMALGEVGPYGIYIHSNDSLLYCAGISIVGIIVSAASKNPEST